MILSEIYEYSRAQKKEHFIIKVISTIKYPSIIVRLYFLVAYYSSNALF